MACKNLSPLLASSLSVPSLESPTVHWYHPPWSISPSAFTHAIPSNRDSDEQIQCPFWDLSSRKNSLISTSPPLLYHLCTHPPPICRYSNTIPNNHYPCLYLPLFVAPWKAGDAPYSSLFTESSAQDLTPKKHSVHMVGFEFTLGKKTAKIFRSQSVSALPCYETPISISIYWMLHRAFLGSWSYTSTPMGIRDVETSSALLSTCIIKSS